MRAVLALWVMVFAHLVPWATRRGQWTGAVWQIADWLVRLFQSGDPNAGATHPAVLAFIVLSGYCIHRSGLKTLTSYGRRRFFRIYPLYIGASLFGVAAWWIGAKLNGGNAPPESGTPQILLSCFAYRSVGLPAILPWLSQPPCRYQGNGPLNTVMVEIVLYAAYPLLLSAGRRFSMAWLWAGLGVLLLAGTAAATLTPPDWHLAWAWNNSSLFGFLPYWWLGAALVEYPRLAESLLKYRVPIFAGIAVLLLACLIVTPSMPLVELRKVFEALAICVVIVGLDRPLVSAPGIPAMGRAGYSIYAFHAPICYVLLQLGTPWPLIVAVAVAFGMASYYLVERPLMAFGRRSPATAPARTSGSRRTADPTPSASRSVVVATRQGE